MTRRIRNLSLGFTAYGLFLLSVTTLISVTFAIISAFIGDLWWYFLGLAFVVQVIGVLASAPSAIAAYGLHKRTNWARSAAMLAAIFMLADVPIGMTLGVYTLLNVSSGDMAKALDNPVN